MMNLLLTGTQEDMDFNLQEEEDKKTNFLSEISFEKIKKREFFNHACLQNKIVIYKNKLFVGNGFSGEIKRVSLFIKEGRKTFKESYLEKDDMGNDLQDIPDFEYLVVVKDEVYIIFKSKDDELEIFRFDDIVKICVFVESTSEIGGNVIYACCICDKIKDIFLKDVTTNVESAQFIYALFNYSVE